MFVRKKLFLSGILSFIIICTFNLPIYATPSYPDIFGEAAILMDGNTGEILYSKNENKRLYPASITKLATALIAIENKKPTDIITMSKEAVYSIERGSSHIGLDVGEQISLDQGLHALLLDSANESANGIAELCDGTIEDFAKGMTTRVKELGAKNTNFTNPHGLHDPNHYSTAYDMALITREVIKQPYFQHIMTQKTYQIPPTNKSSEIRYLSQQHKLMNELRDSRMYRNDVIAGKTGFTNEAGNTLVTVAKREDIELICVVLKSNSANLYSDTNLLLDYGFDNFKSISLHQKDNIIDVVPMYTVKSGQLIHMADCDIAVEDNINILASTDLKQRKIDTIVSLPPRIDKSASLGDVVGTIAYNYEGESLLTSNLVIENLSYIPALEPATFPQKPMYTIPPTQIPSGLNLILLCFTAMIILVGIVRVNIKHSRRIKQDSIRKKTLRFSKTIK